MNPRTRLSLLRVSGGLLAAVCALALAACGSSSSSSSKASSSAKPAASAGPVKSGHVAVAIRSFAFHPASLTVTPGTKITFTNDDQTAHTATSTKTGVFDTGTIEPGKSMTITISTPGTYSYYCQFHAFMMGTITVK